MIANLPIVNPFAISLANFLPIYDPLHTRFDQNYPLFAVEYTHLLTHSGPTDRHPSFKRTLTPPWTGRLLIHHHHQRSFHLEIIKINSLTITKPNRQQQLQTLTKINMLVRREFCDNLTLQCSGVTGDAVSGRIYTVIEIL